jgi:hypothetical protein
MSAPSRTARGVPIGSSPRRNQILSPPRKRARLTTSTHGDDLTAPVGAEQAAGRSKAAVARGVHRRHAGGLVRQTLWPQTRRRRDHSPSPRPRLLNARSRWSSSADMPSRGSMRRTATVCSICRANVRPSQGRLAGSAQEPSPSRRQHRRQHRREDRRVDSERGHAAVHGEFVSVRERRVEGEENGCLRGLFGTTKAFHRSHPH